MLDYVPEQGAPTAAKEPAENARGALHSGIRSSVHSHDVERLERLVRDHYKLLWRFAQRMGVDAVEAEDITQSVFLVAVEGRHVLIEGKERAFLMQTTANKTRKALRARGRRAAELPEDSLALTDGVAGVDEKVDQQRHRLLLDGMLQRLPVKLREVFVLFEVEDYSQPEVAELLGLPLGTVASRLRRGRVQFSRIAAKHQILLGGSHART